MGELQWEYEGNRRGPKGAKGDQGLPGVNAVPTADAVAAYLNEAGNAARVAVDARVSAGVAPVAADLGGVKTRVTTAETALSSRLSDATLEAKYATIPRAEAMDMRAEFSVAQPSNAMLATLAAGILNPANDVRVVCLGSSTMAGHHTYYAEQAVATRLALRAGATAIESLDAVAENISASGMRWFQGAVGGTTSATFYPTARRTKVGYIKPHYALIMVGSNDFSNQVTVATYEANIRSAIAHLKTQNANVVTVLIHQQARMDVTAPTITWAQYGAVLKKVAGDTANVMFVDLDSYLASAQMGGSNRLGLVSIDTVHMDEIGHLTIADIIGAEMGIPSETNLIRVEKDVPVALPASATYTADVNFLSGITVRKANYPRLLKFYGGLFLRYEGTSVKEMTFEVTQTGEAAVAKAIRVHPAAGLDRTQDVNLGFYLKPGKEATVRVALNLPAGGGGLYISGSSAYSWLNLRTERI